ncbi:MAG TPA: hypothetical protein VLB67_14110 [Acidimicrobiia bacterium]|nr:hypothetical protein [Acidimicrobiia bacterium]
MDLSGIGLLDVVIAVLLAAAIWKSSIWLIRLLSWSPPEVDPDDVVEVDQAYKCSVCGAELVMTAVNVQEDAAPRHCREDMIPVWRP